jgi:hypothetical protein
MKSGVNKTKAPVINRGLINTGTPFAKQLWDNSPINDVKVFDYVE